uniref:DUF6598 domain-containing protein n=1 Tax=Oryza rufipogon TaxID=4529 RepID=A0A0E0PP69_ORYRU
MAEIDRMVPVMKLDPARQPWLTVPGRSSCTCDCCNVTTKKKPSNKALIPAWLFRSDDDDDDHHEESAEEEEEDNLLQGLNKHLAEYRIGQYEIPLLVQPRRRRRQRRLLVYGIVAARDDMEGLPNFVFNRTRDNAQEVTLSSPALELSSPLRGISAFEHVLLEFDLKLKNTAGDGADADADDVLVDACIEFVDRTITCSAGRLLRSRIEGPICSLDMDYMFVKSSVEAAVEVFLGDSCASCFQSVAAVYRAIAGDGDGGGDGIVIHEESIPLPPKLMLAADTATAQAAAAATVVAVPSAGELTVTLGEAERAELQRVVGFVVPAGARGGEPGAGQRCRRRLVHPVLGVPREAEEAVAVGGAREDEGRGVAPLAGRQLGVQLVEKQQH